MGYKDKKKHNEYTRMWQIRHTKEGLCVSCSRPKSSNSVYCLIHLTRHCRSNKKYHLSPTGHAKDKVSHRERYTSLKLENKCVDCGMPLDLESRMSVYCMNCYMIHKEGK